jgi:hypothetical protein
MTALQLQKHIDETHERLMQMLEENEEAVYGWWK